MSLDLGMSTIIWLMTSVLLQERKDEYTWTSKANKTLKTIFFLFFFYPSTNCRLINPPENVVVISIVRWNARQDVLCVCVCSAVWCGMVSLGRDYLKGRLGRSNSLVNGPHILLNCVGLCWDPMYYMDISYFKRASHCMMFSLRAFHFRIIFFLAIVNAVSMGFLSRGGGFIFQSSLNSHRDGDSGIL